MNETDYSFKINMKLNLLFFNVQHILTWDPLKSYSSTRPRYCTQLRFFYSVVILCKVIFVFFEWDVLLMTSWFSGWEESLLFIMLQTLWSLPNFSYICEFYDFNVVKSWQALVVWDGQWHKSENRNKWWPIGDEKNRYNLIHDIKLKSKFEHF